MSKFYINLFKIIYVCPQNSEQNKKVYLFIYFFGQLRNKIRNGIMWEWYSTPLTPNK